MQEIIQLVSTGIVALPEFQRGFVWDPTQVVELLESVANGWPIGALLLLEGPQPFRVKKIDGGPAVERGSVRLHLLDGQQRVTALFHALTDTGDTVYYVDFSDVSELDPIPHIRWLPRRRYVQGGNLRYTVKELMAERFVDSSSIGSAAERRLREQRDNVLGYLRGGYEFSAIVMRNDIDLEALTRIFETLNRTGVKLDAFDLMVAVLYPHNFHLRDNWENALRERPVLEELGSEGLEVLKLIALWEWMAQRSVGKPVTARSVSGIRQKDVLALKPQVIVQNWEAAVKAYADALDFMRDRCGVDGGSIPSVAMILTLAHKIKSGELPDDILRWYWRAIVQQAYAQGANTQVLTDVLDRDKPDVDIQAVLTSNLGEPIRRSRILRFGLRGAAIVGQAQDPLRDGMAVRRPVVDTSVDALLTGRVSAAPGALVRDLVIVSATDEGRAPRVDDLDYDALRDQGFRGDDSAMSRTTIDGLACIYSWIGEWL